jgi:hypothetical protein
MIVADDTIFPQKNIDDLIEGITTYNFPFLAGFSNIDLGSMKDVYTMSFKGEPLDRFKRNYELLTKDDLFDEKGNRKLPRYIQVRWQGFSLATIRRDVVEKIPFEDDAAYNGNPYGCGCCVDTCYSYQCIQKKIPMYCDTNVQFIHLRENAGSLMKEFKAGIDDRIIEWEKDGKIAGKWIMKEFKRL